MKKVVILAIVFTSLISFPAKTNKAWHIEKLIEEHKAPSYYHIDRPLHIPYESSAELINL